MNIQDGKIKYKKKTIDSIIYNKNKLIDIISCPICLEKYKHPRNLKCGHPFCTTCLHMININNEITCPVCRQITKFDENNLLIHLPVNSILISIIDESNTKIHTSNLKLKRSKSIDSFITFKKNIIKRNIFYNETTQPNVNNIYSDYIVECDRECCSFQ
tara:strand:+ start:932 stop:1408 length:477 start_codon:yes stop_codon:yes gene_type:complete